MPFADFPHLAAPLRRIVAKQRAARQAVPAPIIPRGVDRTPPHDKEAEADLVASILHRPEQLTDPDVAAVEPSTFHVGHLATIFGVILDRHTKELPISPQTVADDIDRRGLLPEDRGGREVLDTADRMYPESAEHAAYYARKVMELAVRRSVIARAGDVAAVARDPSRDLGEVREAAERLAGSGDTTLRNRGESGDTTPKFCGKTGVVSPVASVATGRNWEPFPVEVLPPELRGFVKSSAAAKGCDPSFVALPLLTACASAIGPHRRIRFSRDWSEPAIIWTAIVGESGTQKSPAVDAGTFAVRERQERDMREHQDAMKEYRRKCAALRKEKGGDLPPPPVCPRTWTADTTPEKLAVLLGENPRGPALIRDELSGLFEGFNRYSSGGGEEAMWIQLHGGRSLVVDRVKGTIYVPRACVSITGGIQPGILRRCLRGKHTESGLAARFLFAHPPRMAKRWTGRDVSHRAEDRVRTVFDRLYSLESLPDPEGDPKPIDIPLSPDASRIWAAFVNEHGRATLDTTGALASAFAKLESYAGRLALVVHLVRDDADPEEVDEQSIEAGIVLSRWFAGEAERIYHVLDESPQEEDFRRLAEWIEARGGSATVRDVQRSAPRSFRGEAEKAIQAMVDGRLGDWKWSKSPSGGRPVRVFHLGTGDSGDRRQIPAVPEEK